MEHLRKTMNRRIGLRSPKWLLKIGAFFIGTETELILKSRWVIPEKLESEGFTFTFNDIGETLQQILNKQ